MKLFCCFISPKKSRNISTNQHLTIKLPQKTPLHLSNLSSAVLGATLKGLRLAEAYYVKDDFCRTFVGLHSLLVIFYILLVCWKWYIYQKHIHTVAWLTKLSCMAHTGHFSIWFGVFKDIGKKVVYSKRVLVNISFFQIPNLNWFFMFAPLLWLKLILILI